MSEGYVVDAGHGEIAGIVVRQQGERGYRFHASSPAYHALNGQVFSSPMAAERAIRSKHAASKSPPKFA